MQVNDELLIRRLADYERLSGVFWIVLGAIQVCMVVTALAGGWNIYAGVTRINASKRIRARDADIPHSFESMTPLIIIGVINLIVGGIIGILLIAFDFYVRDKVLANAHLFDGTDAAMESASPASQPTQIDSPSAFDHQLRTLAKLRDDGVISEDDFSQKKAAILGL